MSNSEDILNAFVTFQRTFDEDHVVREKIREVANELDQIVSKTVTILQGIHLVSTGDYSGILSTAKTSINACGEIYEKLAKCVDGNYYKYHDHWKHETQKAVLCITLIEFLESKKLATKCDVADKLHIKADQKDGFHLDLEDYLHGLLQLISELGRLAVNSAACGNYSLPGIISQFVNEVNAGFRLMNFKNDSLRKHYDCFKYDLKKIEEVVYDLSIRGLKPPQDGEGSLTAVASS